MRHTPRFQSLEPQARPLCALRAPDTPPPAPLAVLETIWESDRDNAPPVTRTAPPGPLASPLTIATDWRVREPPRRTVNALRPRAALSAQRGVWMPCGPGPPGTTAPITRRPA